MDPRLIVYAIWALAMVLVWGAVVVVDWWAYRDTRDRRNSLAELIPDVALLGSSFAAAASLLVLIVPVVGGQLPWLRGFALAFFLGGFLGAGIIKLTFRAIRLRRP